MKLALFTLCYLLVLIGGIYFLRTCVLSHRNGLAVMGGCLTVAFGLAALVALWRNR